jgi:hypothetical protein
MFRGQPVCLRFVKCYHDVAGNPEKLQRALKELQLHTRIAYVNAPTI